jgi:hypothetical protein
VLDPIRVCARYRPKFGKGAKGDGLAFAQFRTLYQGDPFDSWFGLDNPLMYAAHKAAGGMTSVYREIGIGCEKLFRTITDPAQAGIKTPLTSAAGCAYSPGPVMQCREAEDCWAPAC